MIARLGEMASMTASNTEDIYLSDLHHSMALEERLCIALGLAIAGSPHVLLLSRCLSIVHDVSPFCWSIVHYTK